MRDMKIYAIYDLKTGQILQTHHEVDESGESKVLDEDEVLSLLLPEIDRTNVGVTILDKRIAASTNVLIDTKTKKIVPAPKT